MNTDKEYKRFHLSSSINIVAFRRYVDNLIYTQTNLNIPVVLEADDAMPVMHTIVGIFIGYEQCSDSLNILWEPFTTYSTAEFLSIYEQMPDNFYVQPLGAFDNKTNTIQKITGFHVKSYE